MADSLGILDVSIVDGDFKLTREEAVEKINQWFNSHDSSAHDENPFFYKAKTAMANELYKRFSQKN